MFRWILATLATAMAVTGANAAFTITVLPTTGPFPQSASFPAANALYSQYIANSTLGLSTGASYGNPANPAYYAPGNNVGGALINSINTTGGTVTGLNGGIINGSGSAGLLGDGYFFGVAIKSSTPGQTVSVNQVQWSGFSTTGPLSAYVGTSPAALSTVSSRPNLVGALTIGGPVSQITNYNLGYQEIYYTGFAGTIEDDYPSDWTDVPSLAGLLAYNNVTGTPAGIIQGTYSIVGGAGNGTTGTGYLDVNDAPAPATFVFMGLGLGGVVARFRRRQAA